MRNLLAATMVMALVAAPELVAVQPAHAATATAHKKKPARKAAPAPAVTAAPDPAPAPEPVAAAAPTAPPEVVAPPPAPAKKGGGLFGWLKGPGDKAPDTSAASASQPGQPTTATASVQPIVQMPKSPYEIRAALLQRMPDWQPVIDTKGVNPKTFNNDFDDCRIYAVTAKGTNGEKEGNKAFVRGGLLGIAGAVGVVVATGGVGALAFLPALGGTIAAGAATAAVTDGAFAKLAADAKFKQIVSTCLTHRGYALMAYD